MSRQTLTNSKVCYACGRQRSISHLGYDIRTLKTYCIREDQCRSEDRPDVELVPAKYHEVITQLRENYPEHLYPQFEKLIGGTISIRPTPALVMHILKTAQEYQLTSANATILHMLEEHMRDHSLDDVELEHCDFPVDFRSNLKKREKPSPKPTKEVKEEPKPTIQQEPKNDNYEVDFEL